jgi:hypothetical protein
MPQRKFTPGKKKQNKRNTTKTCKGKVRYRDQREATAALHRLGTGDTRERTPSRVYFCGVCKGHHLTAKPFQP